MALQTRTPLGSSRSISSATLGAESVALRPVRPRDARPAFRMLHGRDAILRWLLWGGPSSLGELEASFAAWTRGPRPESAGIEPREFLFAITALTPEGEPGEFLGTLGLRLIDGAGTVDVGYWLGEEAWGQGYATEAVGLGAFFAFWYLSARSLSAWVFVGNVPSRRVLEKNGFSLARTVYDKIERDGRRRDEWYFVLLREEWERDVRMPAIDSVTWSEG